MSRSGRTERWIDRNDLLARVDLATLLDSLTSRRGDGHRRRWHCPHADHRDNNPSVTITTDRTGTQRWRCWSGGHGGTAIDAVIANRHLGTGEAIRWLNDHHAHLQPSKPAPKRLRTHQPRREPAPIVADYVQHCEHALRTPAGSDVLDWLRARGLTEDVLIANRVGADLGDPHTQRPVGIPPGHPAAVFPCLDPDGNLVYLQTRFLNPKRAGMKYANPVRTVAANPKLAWHLPVQAPTHPQALIITEGIPDGLIIAATGMHSVSVLGAAAEHAAVSRRIARHVRRKSPDLPVVVCFDADQAGRRGADALVSNLNDDGVVAHRVEPPDGLDITNWKRTDPHWNDHLATPDLADTAAHLRTDIGM